MRGAFNRRVRAVIVLVLLAMVSAAATGRAAQENGSANYEDSAHKAGIPAAEFARIVKEFSEEGGNYFSENLTSNESAYLYIVDKLAEHGYTGGAYIGVGPEQNFTYIAKVRPSIAFIVDIRRQAMIQHMMFKAIFQRADDRGEFLSILFSKPLAGPEAPRRGMDLERVINYFDTAESSKKIYSENLRRIVQTIENDFRFPLTSEDRESLEHVFRSFYEADLTARFAIAGFPYSPSRGPQFPTLAHLIYATDGQGKLGNFLAIEQDYDYVRDLHRQNRIIPLVGDFGGRKALAAVANYLRQHHYTLTAYYSSNVEEYLFADDTFAQFAENLRRMPLTHRSLMIRAIRTRGWPHPANIEGHAMSLVLQPLQSFLKSYDEKRFPTYWHLIYSDYIGAFAESVLEQ